MGRSYEARVHSLVRIISMKITKVTTNRYFLDFVYRYSGLKVKSVTTEVVFMLWLHFRVLRFFWMGFQSGKFQFLDKIIRYK